MSTVKLKICGIKSVDEVRAVRGMPIDYLGLNFIPSSTRYLSLDTAGSMMAELTSVDVKTVALFAGRPLTEVNDYVHQLGVDYVQLHGNEPADYARQLEAPVMRAIAVDPDSSAADIIEFINTYPADYFVLDRPVQGQGDLINLDLAREAIAATDKQIFFAGGLNPDNLADVLSQIQPYGIDIAGGVRYNNQLDIAQVKRCLEILHVLPKD